MNECLWYFSNLYDLNRILKTQRSSPLIDIPQRTFHLSSNHALNNDSTEKSKDSNFYVVVSGGENVSSNLNLLKKLLNKIYNNFNKKIF